MNYPRLKARDLRIPYWGTLNLISAISPKGEIHFIFAKGTFGAKEFVVFLRRLVATSKRKAFVIADGHPAHKSKFVKAFLEEKGEALRLFFLPPYSPELNLNELVWNALKGNIDRSLIKNQNDLEGKVIGFMRSLQKCRKELQHFFGEVM